MKIKNYSLKQLAENYPAINLQESKKMLGGFSKEGDNASLTYEEMIAIYGNPSYFPDNAYPDFEDFLESLADGSGSSIGYSEFKNEIDHQIMYGCSDSTDYYAALRSFYSDRLFNIPWNEISDQAAMLGYSVDTEPAQSSTDGGGGNLNQLWINGIVHSVARALRIEESNECLSQLRDWAEAVINAENTRLENLAYVVQNDGYTCIVAIRNYTNQEVYEYEVEQND